jgi:outer membrane lipoprotein-sorting protein
MLCAFGAALSAVASDQLRELMQRVDASAAGFHSMTAKMRKITYTAVIKDTSEEHGTMAMKATKPKDMQVLVEFTDPDKKSWSFFNHTAEFYYPKIQTVQVYDLGKHAQLVDQFLLLGFGTHSKDLEKNYEVKVGGEDTVEGQKTTRLDLVPRSEPARQHLKKVEIWYPENGGYPIQQKFYQNSGDYVLVTYSDVKLNPNLPDTAVRLNLPKGVKKEYPQR